MDIKRKNFSFKLALNLFIEFGSIILFFVVFNFFNFIIATIFLVFIVFLSLMLSIFIENRVALFPIFASGSIVVFGLLTIIFDDPVYLIFKDTLFWGVFGLIIFICYMNNILILKKLFISIFDITDRGWKIVSLRWAIFAFILSISNQITLVYLTSDQWVTYKMITLIAFVLFSIWQFLLSRRERNTNASPWGMKL